MSDDDDTKPCRASALDRVGASSHSSRVDTRPIPPETVSEAGARWRQEQEDRDILDLMLHMWVGSTGVPVSTLHRDHCIAALTWARALPIDTEHMGPRVAALTGGPGEELLGLLRTYERHLAPPPAPHSER